MARLATVDATGHPHLVPVVFAVVADKIVMAVDHKPKRHRDLHRLTNITSNPHVSLLVDHYAEDWTTLWWARADGEATITPTSVDPLVAKYRQYEQIHPEGPTIVVAVTRWTGWSAT